MLDSVFYNSALAEVYTRRILARFPELKEKIKGDRKKSAVSKKNPLNKEHWDEYMSLVNDSVEDGSIVLIHSSMDGLSEMGVDEDIVFDLLETIVDRDITVVSTAFPITNLNVKGLKMKPYSPERTPCWTGMLSNRFISSPKAIRSTVPYNSLAAMGPRAQEMMSDNLEADCVYGNHTPWHYCVENHARIMFIGTTCVESNTIQAHMLPDYMGDRWPIDNWYDEYDTPLKINGEIVDHKLRIQKTYWARYIVEYSTTKKIKQKGLLKEYMIHGCPFGYITDSNDLIGFLEQECVQGRLMYRIPRKYWKKGKRTG